MTAIQTQPAGQWIIQRNPQREMCARCKRVIPAWNLYHRYSITPDNRDPQGEDVCPECFAKTKEGKAP